jgi:two-component system sensor kinase
MPTVTDETVAANVCRGAEDKYADLVENINSIILRIDTAGRITFMNRFAEKLFGYRREEVLHKPVVSILLPAKDPAGGNNAALIEDVVRDPEKHYLQQTTGLRRNGGEMWLQWSARGVRDEQGNVKEVLIDGNDITAFKQAQEQGAIAENIINTITEPLLILNAHLNVVLANPVFYSVFEVSREETEHRRVYDLGNGQWDIPIFRTALEKIIPEKGMIADFEIRHDFPDIGQKVMLLNGRRIERGPNREALILLTIRDITEQTRWEEDVRRFTLLLQDRNRELDAFNYSISHDLKAPLRAIDGFSQILIEDYADTLGDEGKRLLGIVRDNTKKMSQLISDLLNLSRTTRRDVQHTAIDMARLAKDLAQQIVADTHGRKIEVDVRPLPSAQGDLPMISQVWTNLIGNAVKFTAHRPVAHIEIGGGTEGGEHRYYVKDNGAGFDDRYADKLFGIFQRLHSEEEFPGTGVGLAIVKRIINRHGGQVWANGRVDEGATFHFTLPVQPLTK